MMSPGQIARHERTQIANYCLHNPQLSALDIAAAILHSLHSPGPLTIEDRAVLQGVNAEQGDM